MWLSAACRRGRPPEKCSSNLRAQSRRTTASSPINSRHWMSMCTASRKRLFHPRSLPCRKARPDIAGNRPRSSGLRLTAPVRWLINGQKTAQDYRMAAMFPGSASAELTLSNVSQSDAASYAAIVTGFGSVTSAPPDNPTTVLTNGSQNHYAISAIKYQWRLRVLQCPATRGRHLSPSRARPTCSSGIRREPSSNTTGSIQESS